MYFFTPNHEDSRMSHWAYCEDLSAATAVIGDTEAHHLLNVLRIGKGTELILFNGLGVVAEGVVVSSTRRDVTCQILSRRTAAKSSKDCLTVIVAPPKADRLKWMVEKLTEVGVDRMLMMQTQRTVVTPGDTKVDKLKANVVAACKQCGRPFFMELLPLQSFASVLNEIKAAGDQQASWIAHPGLAAASDQKANLPGGQGNVNLLIGPEGGFTDQEVAQAVEAGIQPMAWPGTILRIETAAIVFSTLLLSRRHES